MAAAFFANLANPKRGHAISAGTGTGERVHTEVVEAMREVGLDLASARPHRLTPELAQGADLLGAGHDESRFARNKIRKTTITRARGRALNPRHRPVP